MAAHILPTYTFIWPLCMGGQIINNMNCCMSWYSLQTFVALDIIKDPDAQTDSNSIHDNNQQDDFVMDNVIISCAVDDEEALVDKASSCTGSRRRLVRQQKLIKKTKMSPKKAKGSLGKY